MSNGTRTYQFKPALLKHKQSYFINDIQIEHANKSGNDTIVCFDDISSLRYADTSAREYKFRRLDIRYGNDELMRIGLTLPFSSNVHNDQDLANFYNLVHRIAEKLGHKRPDLTITVGESLRVNWIYFAIGALTLLASIGILLIAILGGVSSQKLTKTLLPMLMMAGFGAYICFMAKPWAKRPDIDMDKFKHLMEKLLLG